MNIINPNKATADDFITASYKLSATEKEILLAVFSKYQNVENIPQICEITLPEFKNYYPDSNNNNFKTIKKAVNSLYEKDAYYYLSEDCGWRTSWVESISFNGEHEMITLEFSQTLRPFLSQLLHVLTTPTVVPMVPLKSINSIRLFRYIQSKYHEGQITVSVAEIRDILKLENKYIMISRLKERVLEPASQELNKKLGLNVDIKQVKDGRAVTHFHFTWDVINNNTLGHNEL